MRKFLLFACAAVVSLAASAQVLQTPLCNTVLNNNVKFDNMTSVKAVKNVKSNARKAAPARIAHDGIYGLYISAYTGPSGAKWSCDSVVVKKVDVKDEATGATYNTEFLFCSENAPTKFYGQYDEAAGTITCPSQYSGGYKGTISTGAVDWKFIVGTLIPSGDEYSFSQDPFVFTVDDDGILHLDVADGVGLANIIESEKQIWNYFFSLDLKPANAVISYKREVKKGVSEDFVHAAYVEDYGTNVSVYGFAWFQPSSGMGMSTVTSLDIDKNLTAKFTGPQDAFEVAAFGIRDEEAGKYFRILGLKPAEQEGYVTIDRSDPSYLEGTVKGNTINMGVVPVFSNIWNDPATNEPKGYGFWFENYIITLDEGVFQADVNSTGINGVTETAVKNVKTYNLFGQEVPATTKGLVIRDGKKFFNK